MLKTLSALCASFTARLAGYPYPWGSSILEYPYSWGSPKFWTGLMLKHPKANGTDGRDVDFIFLWRPVGLACYRGIACELSSCAPVMTISGLDFDKVWFLVVSLRTFGLVVIDILVGLWDSSASAKHGDLPQSSSSVIWVVSIWLSSAAFSVQLDAWRFA